MDNKINEAIYVAACSAIFYTAAKWFKKDTTVAVVLGSAIGQILATPKKDIRHKEPGYSAYSTRPKNRSYNHRY